MSIKEAKHIYMVGVKGFGMASLAVVLKGMGKNVTGSDVETVFPTDELLDTRNIQRVVGFKAENLPGDTDLVITTGAHGGLNNVEVLEAKKRNIPVLTHGQALGETMDMFKTRIGVCGTHGKTTTSAMCAFVMSKLGLEMGYQVGTASFSGMLGGGFTGDDYFVVESDEYVSSPGIDNTPRFHYQHPDYVICMNIDLDHVDVYPDIDAVKEAFAKYFANVKDQNGTVIYCRDDVYAHEVASSIEGLQTLSYGFSKESDSVITEENGIHHCTFSDGTTCDISLSVPGRHNIQNAAGVMTLMKQLALDIEEASKKLTKFTGSKLRFEVLLDTDDYVVINDYAHHPVEVKATIDAAHEAYPHRRLVTIFHPHTVSRTKQFKDEFVEEFSKANEAYFLDIYASARDDNDDSLTSEMIVDEAQSKGLSSIHYVPEENSFEILRKNIRQGDVLLFIGAGGKFNLHEKFAQELQS